MELDAFNYLGSRPIDLHSQNRTVAARATAEKKVSGQRSYRVLALVLAEEATPGLSIPTPERSSIFAKRADPKSLERRRNSLQRMFSAKAIPNSAAG